MMAITEEDLKEADEAEDNSGSDEVNSTTICLLKLYCSSLSVRRTNLETFQ